MMVRKAQQLGCSVNVLDPTLNSPAGQIANRQIIGSYFDEERIRELVSLSDVTTFDLENIDAQILQRLAKEGHCILPSPELLSIIQDKILQKKTLQSLGLPSAEFISFDQPDPALFKEFGYPLVQKAQRGGYDGKGVRVLRSPEEFQNALQGPGLIERFVPFAKELAVLVARSTTGECRVYPVAEMIFLPQANVMDMLIAPAQISELQTQQAQELAVKAINLLQGVGVFGVEMFLTGEGHLLINEISPRTHNSGHYTIEACITDQFEQHLRAILGFPLGETHQKIPAALLNLLGEPGYNGTPLICGLQEALAIPGVSVHLYGKHISSPFRKMGHVTILDHDLNKARERANAVKNILKIKAI